VCSACANLQLGTSPATSSLSKAAGAQLQEDLTRMYPGGITPGELAVVDGGKLRCDQVYFTTLPPWREAARNGCKV